MKSDITRQLINDVPDNTPIWRYLTLEKLEKMFNGSELYFRQIKELDDKYEGDLLAQLPALAPTASGLEKNLLINQDNPNMPRSLIGVSCWHINTVFSDKMWKDYCPTGNGAVIQTTVSRLKQSLGNSVNLGVLVFGGITYVDSISPSPEGKQFDPYEVIAFTKKQSFSKENEFRAALFVRTRLGMSLINYAKGLNLPVNLSILIEKLWIPYSQQAADIQRIEGLIAQALPKLTKEYI